MLEEAEKRDHRRLGREMEPPPLFSISRTRVRALVFWHSKGWRMFQNLVAYMRRRLDRDYEEVNAAADPRQESLGNLGSLGLVPGETCSR